MAKYLQFNNGLKFLSCILPIFSCPLPIKSLTSILKSSKTSGHLLHGGSKDRLVLTASPNLKSGHWKATSATQITEAELNFWEIRGPLHLGRSSFENVNLTPVLGDGSQARCKLVIKTQRN